MLYTILAIWFLACFSALTSYFLDFAFGFPMSDKPNKHAILFSYILFLAKRRMKKQDLETYNLIKADSLEVIRQAKGFMSYEYPLGYCAVCSNVWVSLCWYIVLSLSPLPYFHGSVFACLFKGLAVILLSHMVLRKHLFN